MTRRPRTDAPWKFIEPHLPISRSGPFVTVYGRSRAWRDAGVFQALPEGVIAEAARQGETDLSLVSVSSTTASIHHGAAGMHGGKDLMEALEEAAREQEKARHEGADRRNGTDRPNGGASDTDTSSA